MPGRISQWIKDEATHKRLEGYARLLIRNARKADGKIRPSDLGQDALAQAYDKQDQFRGDDKDSFIRWVLAILRTSFFQQLRRLRPENRLSTGYRDQQAAPPEPFPSDRRETIGIVSAFIGTLPPDLREIYDARYVKALTYQEAAEALGITVGSFEYRLGLLQERLREHFGENQP